jgi:hypothetical protein
MEAVSAFFRNYIGVYLEEMKSFSETNFQFWIFPKYEVRPCYSATCQIKHKQQFAGFKTVAVEKKFGH